MELISMGSRNIFGGWFYEYQLDKDCSIYLEAWKTDKLAEAKFVVGLPGWTPSMTKEETKAYTLGIAGEIGGINGNSPRSVLVDFYKSQTLFKDFYTTEGEFLKKLLFHEKLYMFDENTYYEVTTDSERVSLDSHETFVAKDMAHSYLPSELISEKEKYVKIFLEIFEYYRNCK